MLRFEGFRLSVHFYIILPATLDTAFFSFRGGGRCQVEHERFSLCYSHYEYKHGGP